MGILRKVMIEARNRLEDREEKDKEIKAVLLRYVPETVQRFFIYASVDSETDTLELIAELLKMGKEVCCPKMFGHDMEFFRISSLSELVPGYHHIPEPDVTEEDLDKAVCPEDTDRDVQIVPGLIFDTEGGRMGYGSGVYDRYLTKFPCRKIALAYEMQVLDRKLDLKEKDVRMDALITEKKIREFGDRA